MILVAFGVAGVGAVAGRWTAPRQGALAAGAPTTSVPATVATASTTSTTSATVSPASFAGPAAAFAGTWHRHGSVVFIDGSGSGVADWRVYSWCSDAPPPCDLMIGDQIIDGGHATFTITVTGPTTATGRVLTTTVPADVPVGTFSARVDPTADVLDLSPRLFRGSPLCGRRADPDGCGA
jgi:hypothetical protein